MAISRKKLVLCTFALWIFFFVFTASAYASGIINGYIKGSDGRYIASADIWCDATFLGKSNSSGWYSFSVGAGNHCFTYGGVAGYSNYVSPIITIYDGKTTRHDAVLQAIHKGTINGYVKGSNGLLLSGVDVWCDSTFLGKTNLDGWYSFNVVAGEHRFTYGGVPGYDNYVSPVIKIYSYQTTRHDAFLYASGKDYDQYIFMYSGHGREWLSGNGIFTSGAPLFNNLKVYGNAYSASFERYDSYGLVSVPWPVDYTQVWVKLISPSFNSYYADSGKVPQTNHLAKRTVDVPLANGTYYSSSAHRFWEESIYYYKALYNSKRF